MQENHGKPENWEREVLETALTATVVEQRRSRRWGIFFKSIFVLYILYITFLWYQGNKATPHLEDHVGLVDLVGSIGPGQEVDADHIVKSLRRAFEEPKVKAVILRINSPGGTPVQSAYIYDELVRLRKKSPDKKVYAVVADVCASGAYYVAVGADQIYANSSSIVGSIGVILPGFGFVETMKKLGVEQRSIAAGKNKMFLDPFSEVKPDQVAFAQSLLDDVHQHFIQAVRTGRAGKLKETPEIFSGLFWSGDKALELGLIDGLGSAGFVAREVIKNENITDYTATHSLIDRIAAKIGASMSKQFASELGINQHQLK